MNRIHGVTAIGCVMLMLSAPASGQKDDLALSAELTRPLETRAAEPPRPRTISDITALLDQHKPDPDKVRELQAAVTREPPAGGSKDALATFYFERSEAAELLGMVARQMDDMLRARDLAAVGSLEWRRIVRGIASVEEHNGNFANMTKHREVLLARATNEGQRLVDLTGVVRVHLALGDVRSARSDLRNAQAQLYNLQRNPTVWSRSGEMFVSLLESSRANILQAEGKYRDAETASRNAVAARERFLIIAPQVVQALPTTLERSATAYDRMELELTQILVLQGRLAEAELVVRNVLTRTLSRLGRSSPGTARAVRAFATVLGEQGRPGDAEAMARAAIDIHKQIGSVPESRELAQARRMLGAALVSQSRWVDAAAVYEEMREGLAKEPALLQTLAHGDVNWALSLTRTNRAGEAVAILEPIVKATTERLGRDHYQPAEQRGFLALALAESGQRQRALTELQDAARVLLTPGRVSGEEREASPARIRRLIWILEGYLRLLYDGAGPEAAAEAFRIADAMRGQAVQGAMGASAARSAAGTPALAELIRKEQDAKQQLSVLYATLLRLLNAPVDQQLPQVVAQMRSRIAELEKEQIGLAGELQKRFPSYADLVSPRPATVEQARAALREGETLLSVLVAGDRTYVWAVPKQGAVAFHATQLGEAEIGRIVAGLRRALDPGGAPLDRFPEFDVAGAHRLHAELLKPVEGAWKGAHTLIVVANGALSQLPFGLLPTEAVVAADGGLRFERYKNVPWLIKQIGVTQLPAASTLVTLRALPQGSPARGPFIGFGDPQFAQAAAQVVPETMALRMRNLAITRTGEGKAGDWAPYSQLSPLPDTRDEILAIASALKADTQKDVFLGAQASKQNVKSQNLASRRILAFATHGLIPGDFPNLEEPALALAAPDGKAETGLLTLGDILALKLDADWVVLSACNTAAGDGAGAEAISGLGRGFFYAGSRALLVTHWPVETRSARQLVTTLFERYAANPTLSRAEALRQASLAVMEDSAKDAGGKASFSYAHPLFWAPYALVGDGGR